MSYDNTNKGAIWGNKEKASDSHPDFKGHINIEGVDYWLSGWKRDPNGNPNAPAVKFSVKRKEETHKQGYQQAQQAVGNAAMNQGQPYAPAPVNHGAAPSQQNANVQNAAVSPFSQNWDETDDIPY